MDKTIEEPISDFIDNEFFEEMIVRNEYYTIMTESAISLLNARYWKKGKRYKYLDIYLDDLYSENYSLQYDIDINKIIKNDQDIDIVFLQSFYHKMPTSCRHLFDEISHIRVLSVQGYFKSEECKYLENLHRLEVLRLKMWNAKDIDFTKFKSLKKCNICMSTYNSTKEQIKESKEYIKRLEDDGSKIKFEFEIE